MRPLSPKDDPEGRQLVQITTVDTVMNTFSSEIAGRTVSLIKVDVEGDEYAVFHGARRLLEQHRPHVLVEMTLDFVFAKVSALLAEYDYVPVTRFGGAAPMYHFMPRQGSP